MLLHIYKQGTIVFIIFSHLILSMKLKTQEHLSPLYSVKRENQKKKKRAYCARSLLEIANAKCLSSEG